jgi:hypothetical protein
MPRPGGVQVFGHALDGESFFPTEKNDSFDEAFEFAD